MAYAKPEHLDSAIRSGTLGSLYLFDGPENWLKERAVERIVKKLVDGSARDFNLEWFDGGSCSGGAVASSAQSLPWMSERRVVVVRSAEEMAAADARAVGESLSALPPSTCLIFLYEGKANLRDEIPAQAGSHGHVVTFWTPFPNQLPAWLVQQAKERGRTLDYDAAALLAESCDGLQQMSGELDKLILFSGKKTKLERADVIAHGLPDEAGDFKDLEAGLWNRQLSDVLRQGQLLAEMGLRAEAVIPVVQRVFRTILLGHHYLKKKQWPMEDALAALGIRGRTYQDFFTRGLKAYSFQEAKEGFEKMVQADLDIKTGLLPGEMSLSLLLVNLVSRQSRSGVLGQTGQAGR